ncbi:MAG: chorismate mutase [Clostridia bacterium]|nr:chorismate mutase [Clostridia bacterium]
MKKTLDESRKIINQVDKEMAELFVKRMQAVKNIADYKKEHGLPIYDAKREDELISVNSQKVEDLEIRPYYVNFLKNNMQVSRSYQSMIMEGMRVAYSGTEGAFAHIATNKLFPTAKKIAYGDFESAYRAVENGECDVAVLPVENSYNGEVGQVTDLMFSGSLFVNGMTELAVSQDLLGVEGATIDGIKTVISHAQALGQCADFIKMHSYTAQEYVNTALAAKYVAEKGDKTIGAIASKEAAEIFGLKVLATNINASRSNTTRFAILSRAQSATSLNSKNIHTVLLFTVKNEAGSLAKAIEIIGKHGFNMTALRSRPMKKLSWQYYFYVEAEGDVTTANGKEMMQELSNYCDKLKAVGSYEKID